MSVDRQMLLDDFAKAALIGLLSNPSTIIDKGVSFEEASKLMSGVCYSFAEAMLAERTKRKEQQ